MTLFALCVLLCFPGPGDTFSPVFAPASLNQLVADPGADLSLRFRLASGTVEDPVDCRVVDFSGKLVTRAKLRHLGADQWAMTLRTVQGYLEVDLPGTGQRFGMICLPLSKGKPDAFFAIDGGLSWLISEGSRREQLIEVARRCGISMIRERLSWSAVNPERDRWNLDGSARYASIRRFYQLKDMPILELAHDSPVWLGRVGKYPRDLLATALAWAELARRWGSGWGGVELWNEPDIAFGGDLPADQYAAIAKAMSFGLAAVEIPAPIVGGVMANPNREFLETSAQSGLLDHMDAFSFHNYGAAEGMQEAVEGYRDWLGHSGHGAMPLWITECGRPWSRGPDRPPLAEDQKSALDIVMKGVEARACGVARYFPFVYPFYEENASNFGMTDRGGTPLRSLAAYAQMIRVLNHQDYLGDLPDVDPAISRARVFSDGKEIVAVLYTGGRPAGFKPGTHGPLIRRIEGIDGRPLMAGSNGSVPVPDGLIYVWIDQGIRRSLLDRTALARAHSAAEPANVGRRRHSPVVLRLRMDSGLFEPSARGYRMKGEVTGSIPLAFEIWNLGKHSRTLGLALTLAAPGVVSPRPQRTTTLAPRSSCVVVWPIDAEPMFAREGRLSARLTASDDSGPLDTLAVVLRGEANLARTLATVAHPSALPINERERWTPNASSPASTVIDSTSETAWRLHITNEQEGDRWAYPVFSLPENVNLERARGLILRARCSAGATARVMVWEGQARANVVYLTPERVVPDDGRWHVARVAFHDFVPSTANSPDPDGHLDLARVRRLSVGMNHRAGDCTLEVSDLYIVGGPESDLRAK